MYISTAFLNIAQSYVNRDSDHTIQDELFMWKAVISIQNEDVKRFEYLSLLL